MPLDSRVTRKRCSIQKVSLAEFETQHFPPVVFHRHRCAKTSLTPPSKKVLPHRSFVPEVLSKLEKKTR